MPSNWSKIRDEWLDRTAVAKDDAKWALEALINSEEDLFEIEQKIRNKEDAISQVKILKKKVKETISSKENSLDDITLNTSNSNKVQISVPSNLNYLLKVWAAAEGRDLSSVAFQCLETGIREMQSKGSIPVSYTHLRAHETEADLVCRLLLEKKYKQYGVTSKDLTTLKIRMDEIPVSLALAQAAKETGWGTSRFAQEGNALFGQWTWSGEGLKPKEADENKGHKVMKFNVLQASVRAYQRNLNTHRSYKNFRLARAHLRDNNQPLDSLILSQFLKNYAETGNQYVEVLQKIINQNNLKDFDDAKLLPSSKDLESLI